MIYEVEPEITEEIHYYCSVEGCDSIAFSEDFALLMGCAKHGTMLRAVRQFQNGKMISEFKESAYDH